ncbi:MAG: hypothetical protein R3C44_00220 [Chloroflexota bacterium]
MSPAGAVRRARIFNLALRLVEGNVDLPAPLRPMTLALDASAGVPTTSPRCTLRWHSRICGADGCVQGERASKETFFSAKRHVSPYNSSKSCGTSTCQLASRKHITILPRSALLSKPLISYCQQRARPPQVSALPLVDSVMSDRIFSLTLRLVEGNVDFPAPFGAQKSVSESCHALRDSSELSGLFFHETPALRAGARVRLIRGRTPLGLILQTLSILWPRALDLDGTSVQIAYPCSRITSG